MYKSLEGVESCKHQSYKHQSLNLWSLVMIQQELVASASSCNTPSSVYVKLPSICASVYGSLKVAIGDTCHEHVSVSQDNFASQCISMDEGMHNILPPTATGYGREITEAMGAPMDEMLSMQPASLCVSILPLRIANKMENGCQL